MWRNMTENSCILERSITVVYSEDREEEELEVDVSDRGNKEPNVVRKMRIKARGKKIPVN